MNGRHVFESCLVNQLQASVFLTSLAIQVGYFLNQVWISTLLSDKSTGRSRIHSKNRAE